MSKATGLIFIIFIKIIFKLFLAIEYSRYFPHMRLIYFMYRNQILYLFTHVLSRKLVNPPNNGSIDVLILGSTDSHLHDRMGVRDVH